MTDLNYVNYLNIVGYAVNALVTFGSSPILGIPNQTDLSFKYQTIITPDGFTFSIWGIIFISEGIFAILQMLPALRAKPIIQEGINYWYFVACLAQAGWVLAFGYEILTLALVLMGLILFSLYKIVTLQSDIPRGSPKEFWGFRFPFEIHCGWIFAAFALNVNVIVVSRSNSDIVQAIFGALSLLAFVAIIVFIQFTLKGGLNYTIPAVFAWALFGIFRELMDPQLEIFSDQVISGFMISSIILCAGMLCTIAFLFIKSRKTTTQSSEPTQSTPLLN